MKSLLDSARKARFTEVLTLRDEWGGLYDVTAQEVAKARPVVDLSDWLDGVDNLSQVTPDELKALHKILAKPASRVVVTDSSGGVLVFPGKSVAKPMMTRRELHFRIIGDTATLTAGGMLEIGCQRRSLDAWAGAEGDSVIEDQFSDDSERIAELKETRDALIALLRRKLAAELRAHPPTRKRAKKAA